MATTKVLARAYAAIAAGAASANIAVGSAVDGHSDFSQLATGERAGYLFEEPNGDYEIGIWEKQANGSFNVTQIEETKKAGSINRTNPTPLNRSADAKVMGVITQGMLDEYLSKEGGSISGDLDVGGDVEVTGNIAKVTSLFRGASTASLGLGGGVDSSDGFYGLFYGGSHGSKPGHAEYFSDGTLIQSVSSSLFDVKTAAKFGGQISLDSGGDRFIVLPSGVVQWNPTGRGGELTWDTDKAIVRTVNNTDNLVLGVGTTEIVNIATSLLDVKTAAQFAKKVVLDPASGIPTLQFGGPGFSGQLVDNAAIPRPFLRYFWDAIDGNTVDLLEHSGVSQIRLTQLNGVQLTPTTINSSAVDALTLNRTEAGGGAGLLFDNGDNELGRVWLDGSQVMRFEIGGNITADTKLALSDTLLDIKTAVEIGGDVEIGQNDVTPHYLQFTANRAGVNQTLGGLSAYWNGKRVAALDFQTGNDTLNKDDGGLALYVQASSAGGLVEAWRTKADLSTSFAGDVITSGIYGWQDDEDTHMYLSGSNAIGWKTANTLRMNLDGGALSTYVDVNLNGNDLLGLSTITVGASGTVKPVLSRNAGGGLRLETSGGIGDSSHVFEVLEGGVTHLSVSGVGNVSGNKFIGGGGTPSAPVFQTLGGHGWYERGTNQLAFAIANNDHHWFDATQFQLASGVDLIVNGQIRHASGLGTIGVASPSGSANLANAAILVGTTTVGVGIDDNEVAAKGTHFHIGTNTDHNTYVYRNGVARMAITQTDIEFYGSTYTFNGDAYANNYKGYFKGDEFNPVFEIDSDGGSTNGRTGLFGRGDTNAEFLGVTVAGGEVARFTSSSLDLNSKSVSGISSLFISGASAPRIQLTDTTASNQCYISAGNSTLTFAADENSNVGSSAMEWRLDNVLRARMGDTGVTNAGALFVRGGQTVTLVLGSDANTPWGLANNNNKAARIAIPHFVNTEEPLAVIHGYSDATSGVVNIAGGSSIMNAARQVSVWTASNNTTVTGVERLKIDDAFIRSFLPVKVLTASTPQIRLNTDPTDAVDADRAFFGIATGSHNFVTGAAANDTVLRARSSGDMIFAHGVSTITGWYKSTGDWTFAGGVATQGLLQTIMSGDGAYAAHFQNDHATTPHVLNLRFGVTKNDTTSRYINCGDATQTRMVVWSNGDIQNVNNVYGAISDRRMKQDFLPAESQWEDVKFLADAMCNFRLKKDVLANPDAPRQLGVVAQDIQARCPGLVGEEDGYLSVKYSVMSLKAIKGLGEAMKRIEALEDEISTLKAA